MQAAHSPSSSSRVKGEGAASLHTTAYRIGPHRVMGYPLVGAEHFQPDNTHMGYIRCGISFSLSRSTIVKNPH